MKIQDANEKSELIVTKEDSVGRADARIVSLISRINRATKGQIESYYHSEDSYKTDRVIVTFNPIDRDKVTKLVMTSGFAIK